MRRDAILVRGGLTMSGEDEGASLEQSWLGLGRLRRHLLFPALRAAAVPLCFALGAALLLSGPSQSDEIYRLLAADDSPAPTIVAVTSVFWLCLILWYNAFVCLRGQTPMRPVASEASGGVNVLVALLVALVPIFGCMWGIEKSYLTTTERWASLLDYSLFAIVFLIIATTQLCRRLTGTRLGEFAASARGHAALLVALGAACLPFFVPWTLFGLSPADGYAALLGPLAIICLFAALAATVATFLSHRHRRTGTPRMVLLAIPAIAFALLGWSDNYQIPTRETLPGAPSARPRLPDVGSAFEQWLRTRPDLAFYRERGTKYPVFIVAAEGGGMTAAYHTAILLARMQDRCPLFARHIFAISAVSGGALGAALFQALQKAEPESADGLACRDRPAVSHGPIETAARTALSRDFLSPMLGTALFGNLAQYWVPAPISAWDRSKALDRNIVAAWEDVKGRGDNPFAQSFLAHWDAGAAPDVAIGPALLLNVTVAELGQRVVISPFHFFTTASPASVGLRNLLSARFGDRFHSRNRSAADAELARDLDLATAVGLSARFPWMSSAGWIPEGKREWWHAVWDSRKKWHIVDGAYADNSGIETVRDVHSALKDAPAASGAELFFLTLFEDDSFRLRSSGGAFRELQGPVSALLTARKEAGYQTFLRFWAQACSEDETCRGMRPGDSSPWFTLTRNIWHVLKHPDPDDALPLGWRISKRSQRIIDERIGDMDNCNPTHAWERIRTPGCAAWQLRQILEGSAPKTEVTQR